MLRLFDQLAATATRLADRLANALRSACRPSVAGGVVADLTRSRAELIAENAFLRQQLIVASRGAKRPVFRGHERGLSETHLLRVLAEYALRYFNSARPHQGIGQRIPVPGGRVRARSGSVTALPVLGGLHHDYRAAA